MKIGDLVVSTHGLDPEWILTGEVVALTKGLLAVRITRATRRSDGTEADADDPWRKTGTVQRSASFLWRKL